MPKIVHIDGQHIKMSPTDWKFRRSRGDPTDLDAQFRIVPPGHMVLYKEDDNGDIVSQQPMDIYLGRCEALGKERKKQSGRITRPLYLVDNDRVWIGAYVVSP